MPLHAYTSAPVFRAGTLAAHDVMTLRANAAVLEQASRLPRPLFVAHRGHPEEGRANPFVWGEWSFQHRQGLTTLTLVVDIQRGAAERLRVRLDGVERADVALAGGVQQVDVALGALGLVDRAEVLVTLEIHDPGEPAERASWGRYALWDAYVHPYRLVPLTVGAWPGLPTSFSSGISDGKLNQLAACEEWCAARMAVVPRPLLQAFRYVRGIAWAGTHRLWSASAIRTPLHDQLRVDVLATAGTVPNTGLRLKVNGAIVLSEPYAPRATGIRSFVASLAGHPVGALLWVELEEVWAQEPVDGDDTNEYTLTYAGLQSASPTAAALPTGVSLRSPVEIVDLRARLDALRAILQTVYDRVGIAGSETWDQSRLFRRNFGADARQREYFSPVSVPFSQRRQGDALWVAGTGISLGWAGAAREGSPSGLPVERWTRTESLVAGGSRDRALVSLAGIPDLPPGTSYVLTGNGEHLLYAAEHLR